MTSRKPITPTQIIPAGQPLPQQLPAPASPPPPPPAPPAPPALPPWWAAGPPPPPPPQPVDVYVHVDVAVTSAEPEPEPPERWWHRIRIAYNAACAALGFAICGPWAWVLNSVHHHGPNGLAGAWVMAVIPLVVIGFLDNARQVEARCANPDLWAPKWRAALTRTLLWALIIATALTLPVATLVYALTGVQPA